MLLRWLWVVGIESGTPSRLGEGYPVIQAAGASTNRDWSNESWQKKQGSQNTALGMITCHLRLIGRERLAAISRRVVQMGSIPTNVQVVGCDLGKLNVLRTEYKKRKNALGFLVRTMHDSEEKLVQTLDHDASSLTGVNPLTTYPLTSYPLVRAAAGPRCGNRRRRPG